MQHVRCAAPVLALLFLTVSAHAQPLGAREQWQPQTEDDPRLQQQVEIEILGRAATTGLPLLAEKTGVSLSVAPEDLATMGERKFSVFAHGCTLKDIMVQLAKALQECHWDVDPSGEHPTYCLHRNSGMDNTVTWLSEREAARKEDKQRDSRLNRMAEAHRALTMPPEELAELEETDLLMARSVQDPHSRDLLEILLSLPADQAEQFRDTGRLEIDYIEAPERLQEAMHCIADWFVDRLRGEKLAEEVRNWRDHLSHATISFEDHHVDHGWGVWLSLNIPAERSWPRIHDVALHPRYCNLDEGQLCYTRLLTATGTPDDKAAFDMAVGLDRGGFRAAAAKREERHNKEWTEPTDPDLLQTVVLGDTEFSEFAQVQQVIAEQTGLSIMSDYFTHRSPFIPDEARKGLPLWRLLYVLGEDESRGDVYLWQKLGKCLVFHRVDWYSLADQELPESLLLAYREKLQAQGEFTLEDIAAFAVALGDRPAGVTAIPDDLARPGLMSATFSRWGLTFYASLSPDQIAKARGEAGLSYQDMTIAQRQQVLEAGQKRPPAVSRGEAAQAVFHIVEETRERKSQKGTLIFSTTVFRLRFPSKPYEESVTTTSLVPPAEETTVSGPQ